MKFGETLLQARKAQGLSQEALAEKIGVSRQAVSKWETGEALPDLQKAVLLSEALGISLDQLCGKEGAPSEGEAPTAGKKNVFHILCSLVCLCAGILLGSILFGRGGGEVPQVPQGSAMPDVVTVSNVAFSSWGYDDSVTYQFVPSVTGNDYIYRISFTDLTGETLGFDATCRDGMCAGTVQLPPYGEYSVAVTINDGVEERAVSLATGLTVYDNKVLWTPCAP